MVQVTGVPDTRQGFDSRSQLDLGRIEAFQHQKGGPQTDPRFAYCKAVSQFRRFKNRLAINGHRGLELPTGPMGFR